jgi:hypothetical protein
LDLGSGYLSDFGVSMAARTQRDDIIERMAVLWVLEVPNRNNVMYVWFTFDLGPALSAVLTLVIVTFESLSSH